MEKRNCLMVGLFVCNVHCSNEQIISQIFFYNLTRSVFFRKGLRDEQQITLNELLNDEGLQAENNYVQVSGTVSLKPRNNDERLVHSVKFIHYLAC